MPDEATQAPDEVQDTPSPDAAVEETKPAEDTQPAVDYQQRYESLVPEYTRGQQLIAAARGDHGPEAQVQALQQLGVEVQQAEEAAEVDEFEDPTDRLARELEAIKSQLSSKEEAEQQKQFQELERQYIDNTIGELEKSEDIKLSAEDKRFVKNDALNNRLEDGRPDLEGAVRALKARDEARLSEYLTTKKAPKAPVGAAGEEKLDLSDPDVRQKYMKEVMEAEGS